MSDVRVSFVLPSEVFSIRLVPKCVFIVEVIMGGGVVLKCISSSGAANVLTILFT